MAGFLSWLAPRYGDIRDGLNREMADLRRAAGRASGHRRTPEIVASLFLGLRYFLAFARDVGAIDDDRHSELEALAWGTLLAVGDAQQNSSQLTQDIQSAFDTLTQTLSSLLSLEPDPSSEIDEIQNLNAPAATEEITEPHEPETAEPTPLEALQEAFAAALQTLQDSLGTTYTMLPELSPPNGNGSAYDKFLTMYNELYASSDSETESQTPIDIEA
ncbi:MAG: hypothetical protein IID32_10735 [Planctomycetes bacterium]|nr:hypothetical protein [Planctomycetota bacterium]